jgi:HAD superfamily hydrolase (TIGR01509 family)
MEPPKALIFDLDGVLVDSERLHQRDWLTVFRQSGIDFPENRVTQLQGLRGEQVIEWLQANLRGDIEGVDLEALIVEKRRIFADQTIAELQALPGAEAFLRAQKGRVPLALVTSARLKIVGKVLFHFNWRNIFDALVGAEHVAHAKPHPEPFQKAVERFRLQAADCVVFEDSPVGVQGARAAGCRVCGVTSTSDAKTLTAAGAHWTVSDFEDERMLGSILEGSAPMGSAPMRSGGLFRKLFGGKI